METEIEWLIYQSTGGATHLWLKPTRWWQIRRRWMHRKIVRMFGAAEKEEGC